MTALEALEAFAEAHDFEITSTTGGEHNRGSAHYEGRAIDVRTRDKSTAEITKLIADARAQGFTVYDERFTPAGAVWSGPHVHIEIPRSKAAALGQGAPGTQDATQGLDESEPALNYVPVASSNIAEMAYDSKSRKMGIRFNSGAEYEYANVSPAVYSQIINAPSIGKAFAAVKNSLNAERVG